MAVNRIETEHTMILSVDAERMVKSLQSAEKELSDIAVDFDRAQAASKSFGTKSTKSAANFNRAVTGMARSTGRSGIMAQQAGYQVSDFIIQVQGGTSAFRAFGQQGNQLFGMMGGPWGIALSIGAIAVGVLGEAFMNMGDDAESATKAQEAFTTALDEYESAGSAATQTTDKLAESYGRYAETVRISLQYLAEDRLTKALLAQTAAFEELAPTLDKYKRDLNQLSFEQQRAASLSGLALNQSLEYQKEILEDLGPLTVDLTNRLIALSQAFSAGGTTENQLAEAQEFRRILLEAYGSAADIPPEIAAASLAMLEAANSGAVLEATLVRNKEAAQLMAQALAEAAVSLDAFGGPGPDVKQPGEAGTKPTRTFSGGGGGKSAAEKLAEDLERIRTETEAVTAAMDFFGETMEIALVDIGATAMDGFVSSIVDGLATGKLSFKDFARAILIDLAKITLRAALASILMNSMGLGGTPGQAVGLVQQIIQSFARIPQITPSAKGNAFSGGNVVPFAKGGVVNSPAMFPMSGSSMGLMGEAGPEAIVPLQRNTKGSLGVGQSPLVVNVINEAGSQVDVQRTDEGVDIIVRRAVAASEAAFTRSMSTGQGAYARSLEMGYSARRKAV